MDKKKVVLGMSGGVDSSVAAYLLREAGYEVTGITLCMLNSEKDVSENITDAKAVADSLGIEHHVEYFHEEFYEKVIRYFVEEYMSGRTPNPCNICNRHVKWESMIKCAGKYNADYIATGHYARIVHLENGRYSVCNSVTSKKDQTYALCYLTQSQLEKTLMPVGEYSKDEIRKIADKIGLSVANKADSQDICFIPDGDYGRFIREYEGIKPVCGEFADAYGNILGEHKGITDYTIGQRKGLGIAAGHPVYVTGIDVENNRVIIGENEDLFTTLVCAEKFNCMSVEKIKEGERYKGKIRYAHAGTMCTVIKVWEDNIIVEFDEKVRAVTPGQALVLYDGDYVAGGGTIKLDKKCSEVDNGA